MPELTIIIPVYNHTGVYDLIDDFYRLHDANMFRLIVIDQTKEGLHFKEEAPVHLHIHAYRNLGFSKAMNVGLKLVQTPYTLLANDDVRLLSASWYETAKAHLKDGVLAVNPFPATRTWNAGGEPVWYWDTRPDDFGWLKGKEFEDYTEEDYKRLQGLLTSSDGPGTTMFFTLMRTETRELIGLLDEAYINNGEDYDYNRRIYLTCKNCQKRKHEHQGDESRCGIDYRDRFESYKILTCTHSLVHHQAGVTKAKAVKAKEYDGYDLVARAKNIFNQKWGSEDCNNPDIYGKNGNIKPEHWYQEVDL